MGGLDAHTFAIIELILCIYKEQLDLESIGSSLGIDIELFWSGVEWCGPAIRPGLDNRH